MNKLDFITYLNIQNLIAQERKKRSLVYRLNKLIKKLWTWI